MKYWFLVLFLQALSGYAYVGMWVTQIGILENTGVESTSDFEFSHSVTPKSISQRTCTFGVSDLAKDDQLAFNLTVVNKPDKSKKKDPGSKITVWLMFKSLDLVVAYDQVTYDLGEVAIGQELNLTVQLGSKNFLAGTYTIGYELNGVLQGKVYYHLRDDSKQAEPIYAVENFETDPEFPGGESAMLAFIRDNVQYPEYAREMGIQGTVYFSFVIEADGSLSGFQILKSVDSILDNEVLRIALLMPRWKPGILDGKAVRSKYALPVRFNIV